MNTIHIRPTTMRDIDALPDIERSAARAFLTLPELAWIAEDDVLPVEAHARFASLGTAWVAETKAEIAGFIAGETFDDALHIWELAVSDGYQQRGIGKRLVMHAVDHARAAGLAGLTLTTFLDVPWNAPFYQKLGFAILDEKQLNARLQGVFELEASLGLDTSGRCAMRYSFR